MRCGIRDAEYRMWDVGFGIRSVLIVGVLLLAPCVQAQEEGLEIGGFRVPQYDDQGQMTSQLFADKAEQASAGMVKIEGVRVEFYRDGDVFMEVESPRCLYDQKSRKVNSDAPVSAEMDGMRLTGMGYLLDVEARTVQVMDESRVVFADMMKPSGLDLKPGDAGSTNETVITSKQLFLDYNGRSARFTDSVRIQDEEMDLECGKLDVFFNKNNNIERAIAELEVRLSKDKEMSVECGKLDVFFSENNEIDRAIAESEVKLSNEEWKVTASRGMLMVLERTAFLEGGVQVESQELNMTCSTLNLSFDESNEIDWIEALGEVRILHEGREATAGKAVFDVATDEFLLEDNPKLVDGKNRMLGEKIRFWRSTGRMVCDRAQVVIFHDDDFKTDIFEK